MERERGSSSTQWSFLKALAGIAVFLLCQIPLCAAAKKSNWIEVRSPHFIVESNSGKGPAKAVTLQFEQMRYVLGSVLPNAQNVKEPTLTILAVDGENSLKKLLPDFFVKRGAMHPGGIFQETVQGAYIVLRTDIEVPGVFEPVYHEYTHFVMRRSIPGLPLWLTEGFATFFSDTRFEGNQAIIGAPDAPSLSVLHSSIPLPLKTLLAVDRSSPYYKKEDKASIFYAESWALTHYLILHDVSKRTRWVEEYSQQTTSGGDPVESFVKIVGPLPSMDKKLDEYIQQLDMSALKMPLSDHWSSKTYSVRPLTPAEADTVQAEFLFDRGHTQEAAKLLDEALEADPKLGRANALMSSLLLRQGQRRNAAEWAAKAIKLDPQGYRGYLDEAFAREEKNMGAQDAAIVERDLERAIKLRPGLSVAEMILSDLYLNQPEKLDEAQSLALDAARNEPENTATLTNLEMIFLKQDRLADAVRIEMQMLGLAHDAKGRAMIRNNLGWTLLQHNVAMNRAEFEIRKAIELDPQNAAIIDSLGYVLEKKGDFAAAAAAFRHALSIDPKLISSLDGLGEVLCAERDWDGAINEYHAALAVNSKDARAHYELSLALRNKGDSADADKELRLSKSLDPYNVQ